MNFTYKKWNIVLGDGTVSDLLERGRNRAMNKQMEVRRNADISK